MKNFSETWRKWWEFVIGAKIDLTNLSILEKSQVGLDRLKIRCYEKILTDELLQLGNDNFNLINLIYLCGSHLRDNRVFLCNMRHLHDKSNLSDREKILKNEIVHDLNMIGILAYTFLVMSKLYKPDYPNIRYSNSLIIFFMWFGIIFEYCTK